MSEQTDRLLRRLLDNQGELALLQGTLAEISGALIPILERMERDDTPAAVGAAVRAAVQPLQDAVAKLAIPAAQVKVQQQDLAPLVAALRAQPAPQVTVQIDVQALAAAIVEGLARQQAQRVAEITKSTNGRGETVYQVTSR